MTQLIKKKPCKFTIYNERSESNEKRFQKVQQGIPKLGEYIFAC